MKPSAHIHMGHTVTTYSSTPGQRHLAALFNMKSGASPVGRANQTGKQAVASMLAAPGENNRVLWPQFPSLQRDRDHSPSPSAVMKLTSSA